MKQHSDLSKSSQSRSAANHSGSQAQSLPAAGLSAQFVTDKDKEKLSQQKADPAQLDEDPEKKLMQGKMATAQRKGHDVIGKMGEAMGADFSNVNIHEGSKASDVGALAYTQGNDIHFAQGKFDTNSQSGKALLGHELAHVVQQREGRVQPTTSINGLPVNDSKSLESEADSIGNKVASQV
ncbi:MAG: DUF4157 domain-containing protein [Bacteroidia bacterium]|jgi:hypothetical protein|nr:DUF4157 domain-containing protein [Bacteroidia bacterium]